MKKLRGFVVEENGFVLWMNKIRIKLAQLILPIEYKVTKDDDLKTFNENMKRWLPVINICADAITELQYIFEKDIKRAKLSRGEGLDENFSKKVHKDQDVNGS